MESKTNQVPPNCPQNLIDGHWSFCPSIWRLIAEFYIWRLINQAKPQTQKKRKKTARKFKFRPQRNLSMAESLRPLLASEHSKLHANPHTIIGFTHNLASDCYHINLWNIYTLKDLGISNLGAKQTTRHLKQTRKIERGKRLFDKTYLKGHESLRNNPACVHK